MATSLAELGESDTPLIDGIYYLDKAVIKGSQMFSRAHQLVHCSWIDMLSCSLTGSYGGSHSRTLGQFIVEYHNPYQHLRLRQARDTILSQGV
jgi:hypothetical protein